MRNGLTKECIKAKRKEIEQIMREGGKLLKNRKMAAKVREKGLADYVTEVDVTVQQYMKQKLEEMFPEIAFMGEENEQKKIEAEDCIWVLDPVDGTTNLIHDYHHSAISLALVEKKVVIFGMIYDPYREEVFFALDGAGAFLNEQPICIGEAKKMENSLIAIGTSPYYHEEAEENFSVFEKVFRECQDIRRSGSAALDLAWTACGRVEAYFERHLKVWDYAAGEILVREAGGVVRNYKGEDAGIEPEEDIIAGAPVLAEKLRIEYLNTTIG